MNSFCVDIKGTGNANVNNRYRTYTMRCAGNLAYMKSLSLQQPYKVRITTYPFSQMSKQMCGQIQTTQLSERLSPHSQLLCHFVSPQEISVPEYMLVHIYLNWLYINTTWRDHKDRRRTNPAPSLCLEEKGKKSLHFICHMEEKLVMLDIKVGPYTRQSTSRNRRRAVLPVRTDTSANSNGWGHKRKINSPTASMLLLEWGPLSSEEAWSSKECPWHSAASMWAFPEVKDQPSGQPIPAFLFLKDADCCTIYTTRRDSLGLLL